MDSLFFALLLQILIGCGSNLKNPLFQLSKALHLLSAKNYITLCAASPLYITEPLGYKKQPNFFNCVISIKTQVKAHSLLKILLNMNLYKYLLKKSFFSTFQKT